MKRSPSPTDMAPGGVRLFPPGASAVVEAKPDNLYFYRTFVGSHRVDLERGDSAVWLSDDARTAHWTPGPARIATPRLATVFRGYAPEEKSSTIVRRTVLPYVNGCSAKQIFPPERPGDPTLQLLEIPPNSSEQVHHIHATVRVVHILAGSGRSVVGMGAKPRVVRLVPGMTVILEPMCPHHFATGAERLLCLPLHVFSSTALEGDHPMMRGTRPVE